MRHLQEPARRHAEGRGLINVAGNLGCAMGVLVALLLAIGVSPASAVDDHVFDPELSLTGGTGTSPDDEVPDPGFNHPPGLFNNPCGVATDRHGYVYVASAAFGTTGTGTEGRIDVFDPLGNYLTQIKDEYQPCGLAIDSEGNLYVHEEQTRPPGSGKQVVLFSPDSYPPTLGSTYSTPLSIVDNTAEGSGLAIDPSNDHLYVALGDHVSEYESAANGSALLHDTIGTGSLDGRGPIADAKGVDVYGANNDVYVTSSPRAPYEPLKPRVYVFDGTDGHLKLTIDGSDQDALKTDKVPEGGFGFSFGKGGIAVDQSNGDVYVSDVEKNEAVYQFSATGDFITKLTHSLKKVVLYADVAVDNPLTPGEAGYDSPNAGYVYVTSGTAASNSHLYAFAPRVGGPPEISGETATQITDTEAVLRAEVNPHGFPTTYRFEYTEEEDFLVNGFANATRVPVPDGAIGANGAFVSVSGWATGLTPGTAYRFRVVASNECEVGTGCVTEGLVHRFSTYPAPLSGLPDGRAYELVSPPSTNGRIPTGATLGTLGLGFATPLASDGGDSVIFGVEGGALPGLDGSGFYDIYEAVRGEGGWQTTFAGLGGAQAQKSYPGGVSAGHGYSFWTVVGDKGSLAVGKDAFDAVFYLRGPGGSVEPIGRGSLGDDLYAQGQWISADGNHVVFVTGLGNGVTAVRLEPNAPADGVRAIYDRQPGGPTHVVSLLPGEIAPATDATYLGASTDGSAVVFEAGATMYVRLDNSETQEVESGDTIFAGVSENGDKVFFLEGGDIFVFDTSTGKTTQIGGGGESTVVNVSADGSHVYFVSPKQLDGVAGVAGKDNLYVWKGGAPVFIATLDHADVTGDEIQEGDFVGGLGLWTSDVAASGQGRFTGPANNPSRTTPDGTVLIFESRANLTPSYDSEGYTQVYRYDATEGGLVCISCSPIGAPASSDARLQSRFGSLLSPLPPVNAISRIPNVTTDGETVFFQSDEALVPGDVDSKTDVYEWKADAGGNCPANGGCLHLISSGHSSSDDFLYGMTPDGSAVFFHTGDILVSQDTGGTPSIYAARVGGGFPSSPVAPQCIGDACQGDPGSTPTLPNAASTDFRGGGNVNRRPRCRKGKRAVKRRGKVRCVRKHRGSRRRGASR
ncbi:MAG TPA: hypothetical protein VNO20_02095 [Solirubrobacterales bacterium]|nr:hypothetical protein [Solirubrobacterales bacterium]